MAIAMANVFRGDGVSREIDEELESHVAEAIEQGRDPVEARRAFGSALRNREASATCGWWHGWSPCVPTRCLVGGSSSRRK